jgi:hypothetical protein
MSTDLHTNDLDAAASTSRRRPLWLAAGLAVLALLLLGACGDDGGDIADDTTTTAAEETTTTEDKDAEDEEAEDEDEEAEEFDPSDGDTEEGGSIAMNSETISDCLGPDESFDYDITVPSGTSSTLTVTPTDDIDIVVAGSQETVDDGLSGDPEYLEGDGPIEETITVYEFYGDSGCFELTLES